MFFHGYCGEAVCHFVAWYANVCLDFAEEDFRALWEGLECVSDGFNEVSVHVSSESEGFCDPLADEVQAGKAV